VNLFDVPTYHLEVSPGASYEDFTNAAQALIVRYSQFLTARGKNTMNLLPAAPKTEKKAK
jgi:hypothetical protein